jgi:hypothetical protein
MTASGLGLACFQPCGFIGNFAANRSEEIRDHIGSLRPVFLYDYSTAWLVFAIGVISLTVPLRCIKWCICFFAATTEILNIVHNAVGNRLWPFERFSAAAFARNRNCTLLG